MHPHALLRWHSFPTRAPPWLLATSLPPVLPEFRVTLVRLEWVLFRVTAATRGGRKTNTAVFWSAPQIRFHDSAKRETRLRWFGDVKSTMKRWRTGSGLLNVITRHTAHGATTEKRTTGMQGAVPKAPSGPSGMYI